MTKEEAAILLKDYLPKYRAEHNNQAPDLSDPEPINRRIAKAIAFVQNMIRKGEL